MDVDEELIHAIDRVLSLSNGDSVGGKFFTFASPSLTETSQATIALNQRVEAHRARSATPSTVSSPTLTLDTPPSPASMVFSPMSMTTPGRDSLRTSSWFPSTTKPLSSSDTTKRHGKKPSRGVRLKPHPLHTPSPPSPKQTLPISTARNANNVPLSFIEIPTDSNEEERLVVLESGSPSRGTSTSTNREGGLDAVRETEVSRCLPPSLAEIRREDSTLSYRTFHELRRRIAADPLYLGEPDQISLCYPTGSIAKRRMQSPPPNALPAGKGKWYASVAGPVVNGKRGAVYKGFNNKSDAYLWLQAALLRGTVELINQLAS